MEKKKVIIDTDCGLDDLQALFLAFKHLDVQAITTVAGNVDVDQVTKNVTKVLEIARLEIPVYQGCEGPIIKDMEHAEGYHGKDGLGDSLHIEGFSGTKEVVQEQHASEAIVEKSKEDNFTLICIGPLTNIALALCLDPSLPERIEDIYIMGGTLYGKGNVSANNEYNFSSDPEATFKIFKEFRYVHLVPWEACVDFKIPKELADKFYEEDQCEKLKFYAEAHRKHYERGVLEICDGFAVVALIRPDLCTESHELIAEIYTQGNSAGQISYIWPGGYNFTFDPEKVNCKVYHKFKVEEVIDLFLDCLS